MDPLRGTRSRCSTRSLSCPNPASPATRMQQICSEPIQAGLITCTPGRDSRFRRGGYRFAEPAEYSGVLRDRGEGRRELFVIRGYASVSAEHLSTEPLNLKKFIYELNVPVIVGGVAGYSQAKHLMRTGAAGVLVSFGGGSLRPPARAGYSAPMAAAAADVVWHVSDYSVGPATCNG